MPIAAPAFRPATAFACADFCRTRLRARNGAGNRFGALSFLPLNGTQVRKTACATHLTKTTKSAHFYYACRSRRGHWCCQPRPPTSDETEQLFECLLSQPFGTCDWGASERGE